MSSDNLDLAIKYLLLNDPQRNNESCLAFQAADNLVEPEVSCYLQFGYGHWVARLILLGNFGHWGIDPPLLHIQGSPPPASSCFPAILDRQRASHPSLFILQTLLWNIW